MDKAAYDYIIVSDFHLAEGKNPATQRFSRLENFFFDSSFKRLLDHLHQISEKKTKPWALIFNGDLMDFLRVTSTPNPKNRPEGFPIITRTKKKYGPGTSPAESKWQLERIVEGHPDFFRALAHFVLKGHQVIIIKGNHDVNWFWPAVRYRFLELMEVFLRELCIDNGRDEEKISQALDRIIIRSWIFYIKNLLYVEHGNQYDQANSFRHFLYPLLLDPDSPVGRYKLDLPFGSFFVRYFFNKIELLNPLAPNYRDTSSYFFSLWKRQFYASWYVARNYLPYFFRTLRKVRPPHGTRYRELHRQHLRLIRELGEANKEQEGLEKIAKLLETPTYENKLNFLSNILAVPGKKFAVALGTILVLSFIWSLFSEWILNSEMNLILRTTLSWIFNYSFILLGLIWVLMTLRPTKVGISYRETEPKVLQRKAARIAKILNVKYIVFGHSHIEDVWKVPGRNTWYYNTGTWTPIIDEERYTVRPDIQFPLLLVENAQAKLMRWNDEAGELDEMPILEDQPYS